MTTTAKNQPGEIAQPPPAAVGKLVVKTREMLAGDPLLRWALNRVGLETPAKVYSTLAIIIVPMLLLSLAANAEERFWWSKLVGESTDLPNVEIRGMSFMGDTMVWPFILLIPLTAIALKRAMKKTEWMFSQITDSLNREWLRENGATYEAFVDNAREVLSSKGAWGWLRSVSIGLGLGFFIFNAITCTFPEVYRPYEAKKVYVVAKGDRGRRVEVLQNPTENAVRFMGDAEEHSQEKESKEAPPQKKGAELQEMKKMIIIPKWDTDIHDARLSWLGSRLWVLLLGYFWVPQLLYKLSNLVGGVYVFERAIAKEEGALEVRPLAPDNAGGLSSLSATAMSFVYPIAGISLMVTMSFMKENAVPSDHNYFLIVPFIPLLLAVFFVPLAGVHSAMKSAKDKYSQEISSLFNEINERVMAEIRAPSLDHEEFNRLETSLRTLRDYFKQIQAMPVWPFEPATILRLTTVILIPTIMLFIEHWVKKIFF